MRCYGLRVTERATIWDPRPPTTRERIWAGIWLAIFTPIAANFYTGWAWFSGYDKVVLFAVGMAGVILQYRMPSVRRVAGVKRPWWHWFALAVVIAVAVLLFVLKHRG